MLLCEVLATKHENRVIFLKNFYTEVLRASYYSIETGHARYFEDRSHFDKMKHSERLEIFERVRAEYEAFLPAVLWKLTGDKELFAEAMQNALLLMWKNAEKLEGKKAGGYIYRIALSANSKAWRNRIGKNGQLPSNPAIENAGSRERIEQAELAAKLRKAISLLPAGQSTAIVLRYCSKAAMH